MRKWITLLAAALLVTACSGATPDPADVAATLGAPLDTTQPVIVFSRSGGVAGITEAWSIYADGSMLAADGTQHTLTPAEVQTLATEASRLNFFGLADHYGATDNCADCMLYSLTFTVDGQTKTVTTIDAASDAPAELTELLTQVTQVVEAAAAN
jgi:hypothetical protein